MGQAIGQLADLISNLAALPLNEPHVIQPLASGDNREERLNEEVIHPLSGSTVTYRRCLELQVRLLAKLLTGEIDEHPPLLVK